MSIDVVIPSHRVDPTKLSTITALESPPDVTVRYFVVVDQAEPAGQTARNFEGRTDVTLLLNGSNRGAAFSRNRGFEAGSGEFVLFLDDDAEPEPGLLRAYHEIIEREPTAPGYAGTARFIPVINSFARGMVAFGLPDVWGMAETHPSLAWSVTSNLMVRRDAAKDTRFSEAFPRGGGGEDIDYGLRLTSKAGRPLVSVPGAVIRHGWWNGGSRQYRRLFRWGFGDSRLGELHPEHRFFAPPNLLETLLLGTVLVVALLGAGFVAPWTLAVWWAAIVLVDLGAEVVRLGVAERKCGALTAIEAAVIRWANDLGRLAGNLRRGRLAGFMERFDYFCTRESVPYERRVAALKFGAFLSASALVLWLGHAI